MDQSIVRTDSAHTGITPTAGRCIYEQDTSKFLTYTTAATGYVAPWNLPWGSVKVTFSGSQLTLPLSSETVLFAHSSATYYSTRKYMAYGSVNFVSIDAGSMGQTSLALFDGGDPAVAGTGTLMGRTNGSITVINGTAALQYQMPLPSFTTGARQFRWDVGLFGVSTLSNTNPEFLYDYSWLAIVDIGPLTTATLPP